MVRRPSVSEKEDLLLVRKEVGQHGIEVTYHHSGNMDMASK